MDLAATFCALSMSWEGRVDTGMAGRSWQILGSCWSCSSSSETATRSLYKRPPAASRVCRIQSPSLGSQLVTLLFKSTHTLVQLAFSCNPASYWKVSRHSALLAIHISPTPPASCCSSFTSKCNACNEEQIRSATVLLAVDACAANLVLHFQGIRLTEACGE